MNEEQRLVESILRGEVRAYPVLVQQYQRLVLHMIGRIIHRREDVEDLCQEVFIIVYQKLPGYQFGSKLSTWIATIAYRTAINYLKKKRVPITHEPPEVFSEREEYTTEVTPESLLSNQDWQAFLRAEIAQLPVHYRTVLTLYHLEEFTYAEIEAITQLPEGTVKNYLFRARRLLKERLQMWLPKEKEV